VNSPQGNTTSAAEHTWAMILSMARQIPQAHNKLKQGVWDRNLHGGRVTVERETLHGEPEGQVLRRTVLP